MNRADVTFPTLTARPLTIVNSQFAIAPFSSHRELSFFEGSYPPFFAIDSNRSSATAPPEAGFCPVTSR